MQNRNRFENALWIQAGACNALALSKALTKAYEEARADAAAGNPCTENVNADPAVQLILHQLCHLAHMIVDDGERFRDNLQVFCWNRATEECINRGNLSPETMATLGLTRNVPVAT